MRASASANARREATGMASHGSRSCTVRRSSRAPRSAATACAPFACRFARTRSRRSGSTARRRSGPMYGAGPTRSQSQAVIRVRPPFRVVWSRGLGTLIEFPAVVSDGVAYIANARGTVRAIDMRDGSVIWRHDTPHGKMAASPAVWRDQVIVHGMDGHVWVLRRSDGQLLWHLHARLADRVVTGRGRRRRRLRSLERHDHRARPPERTVCAGGAPTAARSPRPPPSRAERCISAITAAGCARSTPARGRCAGRAASTDGSTGRRQSPRAASSCRARPAAR